jgi:hypothetical protein
MSSTDVALDSPAVLLAHEGEIMAWTYEFFTDSSSAAHVIGGMLNHLNQLSHEESATAKVGHTDVKQGSARGAVIYNNNAHTPPAYNLTGPWRQRTWTFSDGSEYGNYLQEVCNLLNGEGERPLTETEAAYAKFSMSDYSEGTCHMALFWQGAQ